MTGHLQLLPAVDVQGGKAVQLRQGMAGSERVFGDPVQAALDWQAAGAEWIHLADLDAAFGRGDNQRLLAEIIGRLDVDVQLSGGIGDQPSLSRALATGARRVNLSTVVVDQPSWYAKIIGDHGDRLAVGLDVRGHTLTARGADHTSGELFETLAKLDAAGCARYVVTDVARDGMLQGPNLRLLTEVCHATDRPLVTSGGITELADLASISRLVPDGVEGAVIGTALHEGRFTLRDALALTRPD